MRNFKYIYGPVSSWRLGSSLGVDPVSTNEKTCTFDCIYCQLGKAINLVKERNNFVPADEIIEEIKSLPPLEIDYITLSGRGEPTLAKNFGLIADSIKENRNEKIAILTNSSLMDRIEVREELLKIDFVIAKLDAPSEKSFKLINRPIPDIKLDKIIEGIKKFRKEYKGRFALQIMFINENKDMVKELSHLSREIGADEIQLNTPLRPCGVKPLSKEALLEIKEYFKGANPVCVYEALHKEAFPISKEDTLRRRGEI